MFDKTMFTVTDIRFHITLKRPKHEGVKRVKEMSWKIGISPISMVQWGRDSNLFQMICDRFERREHWKLFKSDVMFNSDESLSVLKINMRIENCQQETKSWENREKLLKSSRIQPKLEKHTESKRGRVPINISMHTNQSDLCGWYHRFCELIKAMLFYTE